MANATTREPAAALWLVLLAAGGTFALTMGVRQSMGLFLSPLTRCAGSAERKQSRCWKHSSAVGR